MIKLEKTQKTIKVIVNIEEFYEMEKANINTNDWYNRVYHEMKKQMENIGYVVLTIGRTGLFYDDIKIDKACYYGYAMFLWCFGDKFKV
jgi:hypothetical protein